MARMGKRTRTSWHPQAVAIVAQTDPQIRRFLRMRLPHHGFRVWEAATATEAMQLVEKRRPDMLILDLGLPDLDGLEVIRRLREWSQVPIVVLSARTEEGEKITALGARADDYVTKPFGLGELVARMHVALRRLVRRGKGTQSPQVPFGIGELQADLRRRGVMVAGRRVDLTPIEYRLLMILIKNAGKTVPQRQLLTDVWGPTRVNQPHHLRVYMARLRGKLEVDPTHPMYLLTEQGIGYRLAAQTGNHLARVRSTPTQPHR